MFIGIINAILAGRDVDTMSTSEARQAVAQFYDEVERLTFGQRNQQKVDYLCRKALDHVGLGYFA